jgi:hypothetical protein
VCSEKLALTLPAHCIPSQRTNRNMNTGQVNFHINYHVNRTNFRIWGQEGPHEIYKHVQNFPKFSMSCGIVNNRVVGPSFFTLKIITANSGPGVLSYLSFRKVIAIKKKKSEFLFQQEVAPLHLSHDVLNNPNFKIPNPCFGRRCFHEVQISHHWTHCVCVCVCVWITVKKLFQQRKSEI